MALWIKVLTFLLMPIADVLDRWSMKYNRHARPQMQIFEKAAVVCHGQQNRRKGCSNIGRKMLSDGGNAVDAAIATMICDGIVLPQSCGLGGGFIMTIFNKTENKAYSLIAKETAPAAAHENMFVYNSKNPEISSCGALSIAIPGELKGYQAVHERFGKLPWKALFEPNIKLCKKGFIVSEKLANNFPADDDRLRISQTFRSSVFKQFHGRYPVAGDVFKRPELAKTLEVIANSPKKADALYNGVLTKQFVKDIQEGEGIITEQDMNGYQVRWEEPVTATLSNGLTVYSSPLPGSGVLVAFMLRLLDGLLQKTKSEPERVQLVVEAFKHAFGRRANLADPHFADKDLLEKILKQLTNEEAIKEVRNKLRSDWTSEDPNFYGAEFLKQDKGTDSVLVVDLEGNAVSVTSSVHTIFGSGFISKSTGILLNSHMDDFSNACSSNSCGLQPNDMNKIVPGKRPMSSMSPTVVVDKNGQVRLLLSGIGGAKIVTQVTRVAIEVLWNGLNIQDAINKPSFHHQLTPMRLDYEMGFNETLALWLKKIGHTVNRLDGDMAYVAGIERKGNQLYAYADYRKYARAAGL